MLSATELECLQNALWLRPPLQRLLETVQERGDCYILKLDAGAAADLIKGCAAWINSSSRLKGDASRHEETLLSSLIAKLLAVA